MISMYIIINKEPSLSCGKLCSQVGHAVQKITEYMIRTNKQKWKKYNKNGCTKIVLKINSTQELQELISEIDLHTEIIYDAGKTQCPENTLTAIGIEPLFENEIPKCIKVLKLL